MNKFDLSTEEKRKELYNVFKKRNICIFWNM